MSGLLYKSVTPPWKWVVLALVVVIQLVCFYVSNKMSYDRGFEQGCLEGLDIRSYRYDEGPAACLERARK